MYQLLRKMVAALAKNRRKNNIFGWDPYQIRCVIGNCRYIHTRKEQLNLYLTEKGKKKT